MTEKDLVDFADALKKMNSKEPANVAKMLVIVSPLRQKYEDMDNVPKSCFVARFATIISLANYEDLICLLLASKADPVNEMIFRDAVATQTIRAEKFFVLQPQITQ